MSEPALTYVLTTKNKLPFLTRTWSRLETHLRPDEEVIAVDAGSVDGSVRYLEGLRDRGKLNQLVSEPDRGEAHGFNKAMLLARGQFIKLLTDDDYFNFGAIAECRRFMKRNSGIDVAIGGVCSTTLESPRDIRRQDVADMAYRHWRQRGGCFAFTGLSLMIRRSALPLTGLLHAGTKNPDTEFAMRVTSLGVRIAWCDAVIAIRIDNLLSTMRSISGRSWATELDRFLYFHDPAHRNRVNSIKTQVMARARRVAGKIKRWSHRAGSKGSSVCSTSRDNGHDVTGDKIDFCFQCCEEYLARCAPSFLWMTPNDVGGPMTER